MKILFAIFFLSSLGFAESVRPSIPKEYSIINQKGCNVEDWWKTNPDSEAPPYAKYDSDGLNVRALICYSKNQILLKGIKGCPFKIIYKSDMTTPIGGLRLRMLDVKTDEIFYKKFQFKNIEVKIKKNKKYFAVENIYDGTPTQYICEDGEWLGRAID